VIQAYPEVPCVTRGDTLKLHVSSDPPVFVRFLRWGQNKNAIEIRAPVAAQSCPAGKVDAPWNWPQAAFTIDAQFEPGVYAAVLQPQPDEPVTFDARCGRALFVVRPAHATARLLVILPLFTYQAYNVAHVDGTLGIDEGQCLYSGSTWVTLHRPGGGTGGHPWDEVNHDVYDPDSPRQTFVHWDGKALSWLERNGITHDCCTDLELHNGRVDLRAYRAVASFGHHEYWSDAMRERMERFVANGGNVAFFGANTCWFRVEYDDGRKAIRRMGRWSDDPEWRFTGVSYAYGGGKWIGERPETGYTVERPEHWVFSGTHLHKGDIFGAHQRLIGYECDGAPPQSDATILASASISHWPVGDGSGEVCENARATMTLRQAGGTVFSASTVDWSRALASKDAVVERITHNVLDRFTKDEKEVS
jgi:hypothetical protein